MVAKVSADGKYLCDADKQSERRQSHTMENTAACKGKETESSRRSIGAKSNSTRSARQEFSAGRRVHARAASRVMLHAQSLPRLRRQRVMLRTTKHHQSTALQVKRPSRMGLWMSRKRTAACRRRRCTLTCDASRRRAAPSARPPPLRAPVDEAFEFNQVWAYYYY